MKFVRTNFATLNNKSPEDFDDNVLLVNAALKSPWRFNNEIRDIMEDYPELAPSEQLFDEFQEAKQKHLAAGCTPSLAHYRAWNEVDYEVRYNEELEDKDLPEFDGYDTVYFICFCAMKSNCHTDILVDIYSDDDDASQTTLFESFDEEEDEDVEDVTKTTINPRTSFIANKPGLVSSYNPKMLTVTYLGMTPFQYTPMQVCKPDPKELYGGAISFEPSLSMGGVNQRTLGHCDDNGNYVRITPKDIGMKKNTEAKSHPLAYTFYHEIVADGEVIGSIVCKSNREESL